MENLTDNKQSVKDVALKTREMFNLIVENNMDQLQSDIDALAPKDRLKVLIEISKFVVPTLRATAIKEITEKKIIISFK